MILQTKHLILRPWSEDDAEELYKYASDPEVGPTAGWKAHESVEYSRSIIRAVLAVPETYAVCLKEDGKPIGSVGLHRNDLASAEDEYELGYWIGKPFWGRGLIPEAAREVLRHAFEDLLMERVWCGYYDGNEKSRRVMEKLGFAYHHTTQGIEVRQMNEIRTGHVMRMTRDMWYKNSQGQNNMNSVNKTLYIPLYGKAYVSRKSLFLQDKKAEEIWDAEQFPLKGKAKSKWLAYYMGIRSAVFDDWAKEQIENSTDAVVIQIGCGMDSRVLRVGASHPMWYDVDFAQVIEERKRYYAENDRYKMLMGDVRSSDWLSGIPQSKKVIVLMEGVSMYLTSDELKSAIEAICNRFSEVALLMDCYTVLAAKMSRYKNPIKNVGVRSVYGIDDPTVLQVEGLCFVKEHSMTPKRYVDALQGMEKWIFEKLYAGGFSKKLYKLYEYRKNQGAF